MNSTTKRQVFKIKTGLATGSLVEITSCEDRDDYWYITYRPIRWLDGQSINLTCGSHGAQKIYKDAKIKPERMPIFVDNAPHYGVGVRAAFTQK
jgi:hypothetical protein